MWIVGLSRYFSEVDLWYLLECKARNYQDTQAHFYQPAGTAVSDQQKMLGMYPNVTIHDHLPLKPTADDPYGYAEYYRDVVRELDATLENGIETS